MKYLVLLLAGIFIGPAALAERNLNCANADRSITIQEGYSVDIYFNLYTANINIEGLKLVQGGNRNADVEIVALGKSLELSANSAAKVFQQELRIQDQQTKSELVSDLFTCRVQL